MNPYVFSSIPPPSYPGYQPYIGTTTAPHPNSVMNLYSATTAPTPYLMPQNYSIPNMYLQPMPSIHHHTPYSNRSMDMYAQQQVLLLDDEPSCCESFLENMCCCFGFGPQTHYDELQRLDIKRRKIIQKEERKRMLIVQKELQRRAASQLQQQNAAVNKKPITTTTTTTNTNLMTNKIAAAVGNTVS